MENTAEEFVDLLSSFDVGMLTTLCAEHGLHTRPMVLASTSDNGEVYLLTDRESGKVDELEKDGRVTWCCQDNKGRYLTMNGVAALMSDPVKIDNYWKSEFDAWFPDGKSQVILVKVEPTNGEYWNLSGLSRMKFYYEVAKAQITDSKPNLEQHHGQVEL